MKYNVYFGANLARRTNMNRAEAVNHYNRIKEEANREDENIYIYSPSHDFYVSDYFKPDFLDLTSNFGKLMFEDGAKLLSKEDGKIRTDGI